MKKNPKLLTAKTLFYNNVLHLKNELDECVEEGMIDENDHYYNELLDLLAASELLSNWDELEDAIEVAKILEVDVNAWLALKGRSTVSLEWPLAEP